MSVPEFFSPYQNVIESVTQSNPAVVTTVRGHGYLDGLIVTFFVPPSRGMVQLHNQTAPISVIDATRFSVPIDTRGYDPFNVINPALINTYPGLAQVLPSAENALTLRMAAVNNNNIVPES